MDGVFFLYQQTDVRILVIGIRRLFSGFFSGGLSGLFSGLFSGSGSRSFFLGATGDQGENHNQSEQQGNQLFHYVISS